MANKIKWGILSTGFIATKFADGLRYVDDGELYAVASRSQESADEFGDKFDVPKRYASYQQLADDPEVDVVYIGTPHPFHKENTLMCLEAGKSVLCEKPFAVNTSEAREMVNFAREKNLFLMEAMWTRYLPFFKKMEELIKEGAIGELKMLQAEFAQVATYDPSNRFFNLDLGGGALLDLGIYPLSLSSYFLGKPAEIQSQAIIGETGVDESLSMSLKFSDGKLSSLMSSLITDAPVEATLLGSKGYIRIHGLWFMSEKLTLGSKEGPVEEIDVPMKGNGYNYEAEEVNRCLKKGALESNRMPLDESLELMETMDQIREQIGLRYPNE